jgi:NADH-quinone oxidoreductase subunit L
LESTLQHTEHVLNFHTCVVVALPLLAAIINSFIPGRYKIAGWISTIAILLSAAFAVSIFAGVWNNIPVHTQQLWFTIGNTKVFAGIWLNNLSVLMLALVSIIALPVHIYSMAYMHTDERFNKYFTYLSFFCFSMLALVVVDSMILLYAFWELVGFSSYLLIGFWFTKDKAVQANKKAFIMNRVGDIGLLSAIVIFFAQYQTFDIVALFWRWRFGWQVDNTKRPMDSANRYFTGTVAVYSLCGSVFRRGS